MRSIHWHRCSGPARILEAAIEPLDVLGSVIRQFDGT